MNTENKNVTTPGIAVNDKKIITVINLNKIVKGKQTETSVEEQVLYDVSAPQHSCWIALDLETGERGWYPGKDEEETK